MFIDLTISIDAKMEQEAKENESKARWGHVGTHFDVMNKEFPLDYLRRSAVVFDVSQITDRDIEARDIDIDLVAENMFVAFYTGFIEQEPYGSRKYFSEHPQLAHELIDLLLLKGVSIIGVDFAGIRRGVQHTPTDQTCADAGVFVVENLCNLETILNGKTWAFFTANTYPLKFKGMTGLPCRVAAEQ